MKGSKGDETVFPFVLPFVKEPKKSCCQGTKLEADVLSRGPLCDRFCHPINVDTNTRIEFSFLTTTSSNCLAEERGVLYLYQHDHGQARRHGGDRQQMNIYSHIRYMQNMVFVAGGRSSCVTSYCWLDRPNQKAT